MQFRICGKGDILFLNGCINKSRIVMTAVIVLVINPDAFLKEKFNASFPDAVTETPGFGRSAAGILK